MRQMDLNRLVADNVRLLRARRGLSQEALAARCRLHRTYVGAIERSERNITLKTLAQLATALGVEAPDLLRREVER
ncbi:MAG: helix-turn-helix domain-containing protein [Phycisphaerales bacterium]